MQNTPAILVTKSTKSKKFTKAVSFSIKRRLPEYISWRCMRERCQNKNHCSYDYYKNVQICDRWLKSFDNFLQDMGPRPKGHTLDRIDGTKGYCKENCRWATRSEQAKNTKTRSVTGHRHIYVIKRRKNNKLYITYAVGITLNGKKHYFGCSTNIQKAINIRDEALKEINS